MNLEQFFNQSNILDLSFFNFDNAITAAYFANKDLEILRTNSNFNKFFPILGNVKNIYFPDVLAQLGVPGNQIDEFVSQIQKKGSVQIPAIEICIEGETHVYSLLSTITKNSAFGYLNGIQGQFVDRTSEWALRKEKEQLLNQKIKDQKLIEQNNQKLERLAHRLAKYLSPQIYETIFTNSEESNISYSRKNLTVFFSDIVKFTDLTDILEPERLATVINSYLSEMSRIALEHGGTIDKFVGDAVLVFFGDPNTNGEIEDALNCIEMAINMKMRVIELQKYWRGHGVPQDLNVRMGVATGFCTVGNFGSEQRLDYTALGRPVNLAARLQGIAKPNHILIDETTHSLVQNQVRCNAADQITPRGFARPIKVFEVDDFVSEERREKRPKFLRAGKHIEVNLINGSNIRGALHELRGFQEALEKEIASDTDDTGKVSS